MSGWIKLDKHLPETVRFRRFVKAFRRNSNALREVTNVSDAYYVTVALGSLVQFWCYADTHIDDDNTLTITFDEIDEIIGIDGFAKSMPCDWLQVIDPDHIQLPNFLEHNGSSEKARRDNARRQAEYRHRHRNGNVTRDVTARNGSNDARPDQTRPDQTRPDQTIHEARAWEDALRSGYPKTTNPEHWGKAVRQAAGIVSDGEATWHELLAGEKRYREYVEAGGVSGAAYVMAPQNFFVRTKPNQPAPWSLPWTPPPTKAQAAQESNIAAGHAWLQAGARA